MLNINDNGIIKVTIPGDPVPMARPRVVKRGRYVHTFNPRKMTVWEKYAHMCGVKAMRRHNWTMFEDQSVAVTIWIYRRIPKSFSNKKKLHAEKGTFKPITKPDIDNYAKSAIDSQNRVMWYDDNLITNLAVNKLYSKNPALVIAASNAPLVVPMD